MLTLRYGTHPPRIVVPKVDMLARHMEIVRNKLGMSVSKNGKAVIFDVFLIANDWLRAHEHLIGEEVDAIILQLLANACYLWKSTKVNGTVTALRGIIPYCKDIEHNTQMENAHALFYEGDDSYEDFIQRAGEVVD
eukprot:jgi/Tetstr1/422463/TSEL_013301.t1